jgi:hypothetical protein
MGETERTAEVLLNGRRLATNEGVFETILTLDIDGTHSFRLTVLDRAGNRNSTTIQVLRDTVPPDLIVLGPEDGDMTNSLDMQVHGVVFGASKVSVGGTPVSIIEGRFNTSFLLHEGMNNLLIEAMDLAGNVVKVVLRVLCDSIAPDVTIVSPSEGSVFGDPAIEVRGQVVENDLSVMVNGWEAKVVDGLFKFDLVLTEGLNQIVIDVGDRAENIRRVLVNVTLDLQSPVIIIESPPNGSFFKTSSVDLIGNVNEVDEILINGEKIEVTEGLFRTRIDLAETVPGGDLNHIVIEAIDDAGNWARVVWDLGRDFTPPTLTVDAWEPVTRDEVLILHGRFSDPLDVARFSIGGDDVYVSPDGSFEVALPLTLGYNFFTLVFEDHSGNVDSLKVTLTREKAKPVEVDSDEGNIGLVLAVIAIAFILGGFTGWIFKVKRSTGGGV